MQKILLYKVTLFVYLISLNVASAQTNLDDLQNKTSENSNIKLREQQNNYDYPVIGILTLPSGFQKYNHTTHSYIYSSYVQYFQQSGARIIPLKYTDSLLSLTNKMKSINGLVIPGGGANLMQRNTESGDKEFTQFASVGTYLINLAKKINKSGQYLPVWGTCLGFELLVLSFTKREVRSPFLGENHLGSFQLSTLNSQKSRLFSNISTQLKQSFAKSKDIFYFNHKNGFKVNKFLSQGVLRNHFTPLAYSRDLGGKKFVAIAEANEFPFYGVQFHPEKLQFEWNQQFRKKSTIEDISIVQYFANVFYQECMKNTQRFNSIKSLDNLLIENYKHTYLKGFEQGIYFFNNQGEDEFKFTSKKQYSANQFIEEREQDIISNNKLENQNTFQNQKDSILQKLIQINQKQQPDSQQQKDIKFSDIQQPDIQQLDNESNIKPNAQPNKQQNPHEDNNLNQSNNFIKPNSFNNLNKESAFLLKVFLFLLFTLILFVIIYKFIDHKAVKKFYKSQKYSNNYKIESEFGFIRIGVKKE